MQAHAGGRKTHLEHGRERAGDGGPKEVRRWEARWLTRQVQEAYGAPFLGARLSPHMCSPPP